MQYSYCARPVLKETNSAGTKQSPLLVGKIGYEHRLTYLSTEQTKMDRNQNNMKYSYFHKALQKVFENF